LVSPHRINGNEGHSRLSTSELAHDGVSLFLRHVSVHAADGKVGFTKFLGEPVDLSTGVAEDDSLGDGQAIAAEKVSVNTWSGFCFSTLKPTYVS
jgi:hypothetical protein